MAKKPTRLFYTIGEFMRFAFEQGKKVEREEPLGDADSRIIFTDGSYVKFEYKPGWVSDAGTGYEDELKIDYFETKLK